MNSITEKCVCGSGMAEVVPNDQMELVRCLCCGLVRQLVDMSKEQLVDWYATQYHKRINMHTLVQDEKVCKSRLDAYRLRPSARLLDVGTGQGAFVKLARDKGLVAIGQDLCPAGNEHTYTGELTDIHFPTDSFDVVTSHDVMEHLVNPREYLAEMYRAVKQGGRVLIEIPDFWSEHGQHHWRPVQHLWYWTDMQFMRLLKNVGLHVDNVSRPIPGKLLFDCSKPAVKRVSILVPPGIGDVYWPMVKTQGMLKDLGITETPDVYISHLKGAPKRSLPYLETIPFVHAAGYKTHSDKSPIWKEAYLENGRTLFKNVEDCDYFLAYNGVTRFGSSLECVDPQWKPNWEFPTFRSLEELRFEKQCQKHYGRYVVAYFINHGMYRNWLAAFGVEAIAESLAIIAKQMDCKILFVGAEWDTKGVGARLMESQNSAFVDLTGKTTLEQLWGFVRGSVGMVGFPSGATIVPTSWRVPTLSLWHTYFDKRFWTNACSPQSLGNWYDVVDVSDTCPDEVAASFQYLSNRQELQQARSVKKQDPRSFVLYRPPAKKFDGELEVVCVYKTGGDYDASYVYKLRNMASRAFGDVPYRFTCLTDDKGLALGQGDRVIPFEKEWPGWWSKVELFRKDLFDEKSLVAYFDLDTVLVGGLDMFGAHCNGEFRMLEGFRLKDRRGSGVMMWRGDRSYVYDDAVKRREQILSVPSAWDQKHIRSVVERETGQPVSLVQDVWKVASLKNHCRGIKRYPKGTQVICFHGNPRPHELPYTGWLKELWR